MFQSTLWFPQMGLCCGQQCLTCETSKLNLESLMYASMEYLQLNSRVRNLLKKSHCNIIYNIICMYGVTSKSYMLWRVSYPWTGYDKMTCKNATLFFLIIFHRKLLSRTIIEMMMKAKYWSLEIEIFCQIIEF